MLTKPEKLKYIDWLMRDKYPDFLSNPKKYLASVQKDVKRLEAGEPLAYVIGWVDFLGARIDLSYKPLIPRVETEFWVEEALRLIPNSKIAIHCLDLCAGSGCIGLAILKHLPNSKVVFADNSPKAIRQAEKNLTINKIKKSRTRVIESNLFQNIKGRFDYIFTNPPYIPAGRELSVSVKKYEPKSALFAGQDGLNLLKRILREASGHLSASGLIFFEFDSGQKNKLEKFVGQLDYRKAEFYKDQYGKWRYGCAKI